MNQGIGGIKLGISKDFNSKIKYIFQIIILLSFLSLFIQGCGKNFDSVGNQIENPRSADCLGDECHSVVSNPDDCTMGSQIVNDGESVVAFLEPIVSFDQSCRSEERVCNDGILTGSFTNPSCVQEEASVDITWTELAAPNLGWYDIASSANGQRLIAINRDGIGQIWISIDGGNSWAPKGPIGGHSWLAVTSSADGMKLAAVDYLYGYIHTSTDGGQTWVKQAQSGRHSWYHRALKSSADGKTLIAAVGGNYNPDTPADNFIYISRDSGVTWEAQTSLGANNWYTVDISDDGLSMIAGHVTLSLESVYLHTSKDGGATWESHQIPGTGQATAVAVSSSGQHMIAKLGCSRADLGFYCIYVSNDKGQSWNLKASAGKHKWRGVAISADGNKIALTNYGDLISTVVVSEGYIFVSQDGGSTWNQETNAGLANWGPVTIDNNDNIFATSFAHGGLIYKGSF